MKLSTIAALSLILLQGMPARASWVPEGAFATIESRDNANASVNFPQLLLFALELPAALEQKSGRASVVIQASDTAKVFFAAREQDRQLLNITIKVGRKGQKGGKRLEEIITLDAAVVKGVAPGSGAPSSPSEALLRIDLEYAKMTRRHP